MVGARGPAPPPRLPLDRRLADRSPDVVRLDPRVSGLPAAVPDRLIAAVGAGHVLLGSDFPFEPADPDPRDSVGALGLESAVARAIEWDTAARLLGLV